MSESGVALDGPGKDGKRTVRIKLVDRDENATNACSSEVAEAPPHY